MKEDLETKNILPWAITVEEFRKTGDFSTWSDEAIQQAIGTMVNLTIISINLLQTDTYEIKIKAR